MSTGAGTHRVEPSGARGPGRPWCPPLAAVLVSLAAGIWLTVDLVLEGPLHRLDLNLADRVDDLDVRHVPILDRIVWLLTLTGGRGVILVVIAILTAYIVRAQRVWQPVLRVAVAFVLLTATIYAFKLGLGRTAPGYGASLLWAGGQSYPSGHTANAVLWWGLAVWLCRDYGLPAWTERSFTVLAVAAPLITSGSMLLLNYHWLTDVLMGIVVGVLLLRVLHLIFATRLGDWGNARGPGHGGGRGRAGLVAAGSGVRR